MAYNFEERHDLLPTRMRELNSRLVQYRRGGSVLFTALATVYELRADELIAFGVSLDTRRLEFLFSRADIPIGFTPLDDKDEVYDPKTDLFCKVSPLGEEAHFRWYSHTRHALRIHTHAATYSIPQSELDLVAILMRSVVGTVVATTENLPMATVRTNSTVGTVAVEADLDSIYMSSSMGELLPEEPPA